MRLVIVGEVRGAQAAGLEPDQGVVVAAVRVGPTLLAAEVPDGNVADDWHGGGDDGVPIVGVDGARTRNATVVAWVWLRDDGRVIVRTRCGQPR